MTRWAVFLDRDGTINEEVNYLDRPEQIRLLPGAAEAIRRLNKHQIPVIIITNQSGLARGFFSESTLSEIHRELHRQLEEQGARIDQIYYCPHHPNDNCSCRKPKPGLLVKATRTLQINLRESFVVGDKVSDLGAGRKVGCSTIRVTTGYGSKVDLHSQTGNQRMADFVAPDLPKAVDWILENKGLTNPVVAPQTAMTTRKTPPPASTVLPAADSYRERYPWLNNEILPIGLLGLLLIALISINGYIFPFTLLRLLLGLLFILFVPGYLLQAVLFPRAGDLDGPERAALSFGLSVAIIPLIALLLDWLPWGIFQWPIVAAETLFVIVIGIALWYRRRGLPVQERYSPKIKVDARGWWAAQDRGNRILFVILGLAIAIALFAATAIVLLPKPGQQFTEFYITGADGLAESYPREAAAFEQLTVTMGINNLERLEHDYWVEIWAVDHWADERHKVGAAGPFTLEREQAVEEAVTWYMPWAGDDQVVDFYLFSSADDTAEDPYRQLRLWLNVTE